MKNLQSPESVLANIPGWGQASYRELSGGLSNRTFLIEQDDRRAVLKIDEDPRTDPYNSRLDEARVQTVAADHGLANQVLYADDTVYMTEYLEGQTWTNSDLDNDDQLVELASTLRRLHSLPLTGRTFNAKTAARRYMDEMKVADTESAKRCIEVIESMHAPQNLCCCHNDLVVGNIISGTDLKFLDWEYACDNDPFFDLATIVAHHGLTTTQANRLLDVYFDGDGVRWRRRLAMQERLYAALLWLWAAARNTFER